MSKKIVVIPCSGIGKAYGEICRQAVYNVVENMRPKNACTTCLARVMIDDPETLNLINNNYVITVEGCTKECSKTNIEKKGKTVDATFRTIDEFKEHHDLKPEGVLKIGEPGMQLANYLSQKIADEVDLLSAKEGE